MPSSRAFRGKILRISSADKDVGQSNSNFTVSLGNSAFIQNVKAVVVKTINFKHVFPNIFEGNQTFKFRYDLVDYEIKVPIGWWDASNLAIYLDTEMSALVAGIGCALVVSPAGAPAAQNTYFSFTIVTAFALTIYSKENGNALADVLGISEDLSVTPLDGRAQFLPDLGGLSVVYLCSNVIAGANAAASSNDGENVNIVTEIPINVPFGGEISYRSFDHHLDTILFQNPKGLVPIDFALCTRAGEILQLQQNNLTMTLRIIPVGAYSVD